MILDSIIIGAGPAGVAASIYLKRANLNILVIEKKAVGGQVLSAGLVENYPAFSKIDGVSLGEKFKNHLLENNIEIVYDEVVKLEKNKDLFNVFTKNGKYTAKTVIVSTGAKPKLLNLKGEKELLGSGISYCAYCDGSLYKGLDVAVIGGGIASCEAALYLSNIAKSVTILNRTSDIFCEKVTLNEIAKKSNIKILNNVEVLEFFKDSNFLLNKVSYKENGEIKYLDIQGAFIYIGHIPETGFVGTDILTKDGYISANSNMATKISGLFSCGDCIDKEKRQIITATSDGALAAFSVMDYLKNKWVFQKS